jgi:hypothetical protein
MMIKSFSMLALFVFISAGCANPTAPSAASIANPVSTCAPSDQDQYVYRPARLQVLTPCVRVTGTVVALSIEADADIHMQLRLDAPYQGLVNSGNDQEDGNLIIEPICQFPPPQADVIRICASNPDPLPGPMPSIGDHVWMEGRHVLDLQHFAWAELHPLYRWGIVNP